MKILVTGFDPFGGAAINPSWAAVQALPAHIGTAEICTCQIPTEFEAAPRRIREELEIIRPDGLLCVGLYGSSPSIRVERVAINLQDARIPDNAGAQPRDLPVCPGGPDAYFATAPTRKIIEALTAAGIPAVLSYSAGTYVCNTLFYSALDHGVKTGRNIPCGFLHVPYLPSQAASLGGNVPSMEGAAVTKALTLAIETLLTP